MVLSLNNFGWLSGALALLVLLMLWRYAYHSQMVIYDAQKSRSLHQGQALTGAGILIFVPWCLLGLLLAPLFVSFYVIMVLSVLGFIDDRYDVSFKVRLVVQILMALITLYAMGSITPWWLVVFLTFCMLWWVNLFNFMDGANGMAALHGVVSLGFYGIVFADKFSQATIFNYVTFASVLVLLVYLIFNMWLKKLFMGDSGSLPLAWVIAVMALYAIQTNTMSYAQVALLHSVFIVDATLTLVHRLLKGENVTQAHATHLYQRLIKSGYTHSTVSACYALLTLLCCLMVWLTLNSQWLVQYVTSAVVYVIFFGVFVTLINNRAFNQVVEDNSMRSDR